MKLLELAKRNYSTYKSSLTGASESHHFRLGFTILLSIVLAVFSTEPTSAYPMMVTGITILTGFTFTALFSNHVLADVGLPKPVDESDRLDLKRLESLSQNFKARSSYFILLSIINSVLLIAASLKFSIPLTFSEAGSKFLESSGFEIGDASLRILSHGPALFADAFFVLVTCIFLECLYTFYRLSETIIAIVDIRSNYVKSDEGRRK